MRNLLICLCLSALTFAVYWKVRQFDFVNFDDDHYVYENPQILHGLNRQTWGYAFTTTFTANYHPLTWISYALDMSMFGLRPGVFHLENVLLHAITASLLFLFLFRATGDFRPSIIAGAMFAVHPVHVESVAWIAERKDVLSGMFFMLALLAYLRYVHARSRAIRYRAYAVIMIFLTLGLLAKPMIVTFPFVLLLLDYWPLRRSPRLAGDHSPSSWKTLTIEKIPLLALAVAASLATFVAQRSGGAMVPLGSLPITQRLANSALSYWRYLGKIFWPHNLCVFYPRIMDLPVIWVALSIVLIAVITIISIFAARRAPFLIVGWLFFLGMLVPVIGLVQVGWQSMADRYLYLPIIGPIVMVLWSAESIARHMRSRLWIQPLLNALPAAVIALLAAVTIHQLTFWHDTQTLFNRALAVEPQNTLAHVQLGYFAAHDGRFGDAERHYQQAIHIDPTYFVPEFDLANLLLRLNQPEAALKYYEQAAANQPTVAIIQNNWGIALEQLHRPREAFDHFAAAVKSDPNFAQAHLNLAQLFLSAGQLDSAESEFQATLRLSPDNPAAINGLAAVGAAR